ncbi:MAG: helix-hairpin-helix domain-containing protein [Ignavibacteriae bacterium]|nr:helix-hairpin-helix domain-containing protein [Ignavibacteriota bacterium]
MKQSLKYFSFTKNETKVILFIIIVLLAGFSIKYINFLSSQYNKSNYDYSKSEEMFRKLSRGNLNSILNDSLNQKDSVSNSNDNKLTQKLQTAEDSIKTKGKKKSKKEENLKPKSININTATKEILITLPGVGESTAEKIIKYRELHKGFKKIEHIMKVKGIGKKKFENMKEYIYVE